MGDGDRSGGWAVGSLVFVCMPEHGGVHEVADVGDVGDVFRDFVVPAEEGGVGLGVGGVVAVHGADRALSHVAGDDEDAFLGEPDELAERAVCKKAR